MSAGRAALDITDWSNTGQHFTNTAFLKTCCKHEKQPTATLLTCQLANLLNLPEANSNPPFPGGRTPQELKVPGTFWWKQA